MGRQTRCKTPHISVKEVNMIPYTEYYSVAEQINDLVHALIDVGVVSIIIAILEGILTFNKWCVNNKEEDDDVQ